MSRIICLNSFRRGVGRSTLTANLAILLAQRGQRVGVVDISLQAPGLYMLFGLAETDLVYTFNDYVWGRCDIVQTAHDLSRQIGRDGPGRLFFTPASPRLDEINRIWRQGYKVKLLETACRKLVEAFRLDVLLIDTEHGVNEETLFVLALCDVLLLLLRTDQQDYQGTGITVQVAQKLGVPQIMLVVNEAPAMFDSGGVKAGLEQVYDCRVAAVLPHFEELMALGSAEIFARRYPEHALTGMFAAIADRVMI